MANRYWVGGTGTWNTTSTTNWSATSGGAGGASVPTAADSVFFDQATTYTVTMTGALLCLDITVSAGIVTFATGTSPGLTISGSMSLVAGTFWNSTGAIVFNATTVGKTITTNGTTLNGNLSLNGVGGEWSLGSALTLGTTLTTTLINGSLVLNGYNLTTGTFNASTTTTRSIAFGSNNIILSHTTAAQTVLGMSNATGFTWTGTTGGFTADASVTRTFTFGTTGGSSTNAPNLTLTGSGTAIATLTTGGYFNKLDFGTTAFTVAATTLNINGLTLSSGGTFTNLTARMVGTGSIVTNGNTSLGPLVINNDLGTTTLTSALSCTTYTQTAGTIDFANYNLTCSSTATYTAGTLTNTGTITCTTWTCAGTFTMTNGTITPSTSFVVTGGFNYNGGTLSAVPSFAQNSGATVFNKAYATTATGTFSLSAGSLTLNGVDLTTGTFSSSNSGTRSIAFGSNNIILATTTAAAGNLAMATATGFTWTGTGGFTAAADITRTFSFGSSAGGTSANAPNLTFTGSGSAVQTITTVSYFNNLNFGTTAFAVPSASVLVNSATLSASGTYTSLILTMIGTGSLRSNGKSIQGLLINNVTGTATFADQPSLIATGATTLTSGTLDLSGFDLTTGTFSSSNSNTRSIVFGSNKIILATTTANATVLDMGNANGFTYTGTGLFTADASVTRTYAFGTTGGTSTNAPNLTLTGSGTAVQTITNTSYFNNLDFGTTAFAIPTTSVYVSTLTLSSGGTFTALQPILTRTQTWTAQYSKVLDGLGFNCPGGTLTLDGTQSFNLTTTTGFQLTAGTLDLGGYDLTIGVFNSAGVATRSIAFGSNNIILATTVSGTTNLAMNSITGFTYTGTGGFTVAANIARSFNCGSAQGGSSTNAPNLTFTGSGTSVQTFSNGSYFNKLDFGTTVFVVATVTLYVNSLTLSSGGTFTNLTASTIGTGSIAGNSKLLAGLNINPVSGTTTLTSALSVSATGTTTLTSGTLDLGGFDLTTGAFSSNNTNTRSIVFGSNNIILAHTTAGTVNLDMADATSFTYTGTGGFTAAASTTRTFTFGSTAGGSASNAPNLAFTGSGTSSQTITTGSWFNTLNYGTTATSVNTTIVNVSTLALSSGGTFTNLRPSFTRTQTWTAQYSKQLGGMGVNSPGVTLTLDGTQTFTATSLFTLNEGTLDLGGFDLTIGIFSSSNTNTRSIVFGSNNIILAHTTAGTVNLSMNIATGFTWTGTGGFTAAADITRTFTFGASSGGTSTNAPNLTFTGSGTAVQTITSTSYFNNLNFGTTAFNPGTTSINVNNITLSSGGTFTSLTIVAVGTGTIITNGKTISTFTVNCPNGTSTLGGALTADATTTATLTAGTLDLASYTLTVGIFSSSNANTRSIAFGSGNIVMTYTASQTTLLGMANATNFTWTGTGGFTTTPIQAGNSQTFTFGNSSSSGTSTNAPNLTFTGSATSNNPVLTSGSWFNKLDFGTTLPTTPTTVINVNSLTLSSGGTFTGLGITAVGTGTITPNGKTIAALTINNGSETTTLAGALGCTTYTQTTGTIDFATFNLTCSSTATYTAGTLTNTGTITCTTWTCGGIFTLTSGTITPSTSFVVTGGFNYNGGTLSAVPTFTHTSGNVTFGKAYALTATGTYTLTAGALDLGGFNLTTGIFSSTNTNTRSISFGSGNIVLAHTTAATTVLSMATATGFTITGTGGFTADASVTRTFTFGTTGGSSTTSPNLTLTGSGTSIATLTSNSYFNKLNFGTTAFALASTTLNLNSLTLSTGGTFTSLTATMVGTGTLTTNGKTISALTVNCPSGTSTFAGAVTVGTTAQTILTAGTMDLAGYTLTTGSFTSNNTNTRSISFGTGSIVLATTTAGTTVINIPDATGFTYTGTGGFTTAMSVTRTFTFGSTAGGSASNAPSLALTSGASVPTITPGSWFKSLDFTGSTSAPTGVINVDTLTLATGGTYTGLTPIFTRTQTWTAQFSKQLNGIGVNVASGTLTLDNTQTYTATSTCYLTAGTLNLGGVNQTFGTFNSSGTGSRSITGGGSITINYDWTVTTGSGFTGSNYTIYMASNTSKTFAGGGGTYGTLVQKSASTLSVTGSNTFADVQVSNDMAVPASQQEFTTAGTYSWTVPPGVYSISAVLIGGGSQTSNGTGGGKPGGGLRYINGLSVSPGEIYTVIVGAAAENTSISRSGNTYVQANAGTTVGGTGTTVGAGPFGGTIGGGNGGNGGTGSTGFGFGGGGGAGGYSGNGGNGGNGVASGTAGSGTNGAGGGGGGGGGSPPGYGGGAGGGVGIYGEGSNGTGAAGTSIGSAGSGTAGSGGSGITYGGGSTPGSASSNGAVRIIWGTGRAYPSTNTANV